MRRIKCFIAMAFNRDDTDEIYNISISNILNSLNIEGRRVDRITHNDRIDVKIRDEIENADFVIADLTFSRPSVYWEAGFAERILRKKVIYTCRQDHLQKQKSDDEYGIYSIHFDLRNANIIDWNLNRKADFEDRLKKRINFVVNPIKKNIEKTEERKEQIESFQKLSLNERIKSINNLIPILLIENGFKCKKIYVKKNYIHKELLVYRKRIDKTLYIIKQLKCVSSITLNELRENELSSHDLLDFNYFEDKYLLQGYRTKINHFRRIIIFPSISKVVKSRLESYFSNWGIDRENGIYHLVKKNFKSNGKTVNENSTSEILILSDTKDLIDLEEKLIIGLQL